MVHPCITTPSPHLYMSLGTSSGRLLHIYTIISPWISPLDFIFCVISSFCGCHPGHQTFYPNLKSYLLHPPGIGAPFPTPSNLLFPCSNSIFFLHWGSCSLFITIIVTTELNVRSMKPVRESKNTQDVFRTHLRADPQTT